MNTTTSAVSAMSFFSNIHRAGTPLPRFELDEAIEEDLRSAPNGREAKFDEADAIRNLTGSYSVGEPHGMQLDLARHAARIALDPSFAEVEVRVGQVVQDLTAAERELVRRWRNYERRALLARNALRDLDAEILEKTEEGEVPSSEECVRRSTLVEQVEFWQRRADNPLDFSLEVDQWAADETSAEAEDLESLIASQKADQREWRRLSK